MADNPFVSKDTLGEAISTVDKKKEALAYAKSTMQKARACINTEEFKEYKEAYTKTREEIFNVCENLKATDPLLYAFEMSSYMNTLRSLVALLKKVEHDGRME